MNATFTAYSFIDKYFGMNKTQSGICLLKNPFKNASCA